MRWLILGGTQEGRLFCEAVLHRGIAKHVVYSHAGLVRNPTLDCEIICGGFSALGGLQHYLLTKGITAIWDCTHPYAQQMSEHAVAAAKPLGIPCWRITRPAWQATAQDHWHFVASWQTLLPLITDYRAVLITSGQLDARSIELWRQATSVGQRQWLRTAVAPKHALPATMQWLQGIGPYHREAERDLMQTYGIDCLVSKHSGGTATFAKIAVARTLGIPVYLFRRPQLVACDQEFISLEQAIAFAECASELNGC